MDDGVRAGLSRATGFFRTLAVRGGHVEGVGKPGHPKGRGGVRPLPGLGAASRHTQRGPGVSRRVPSGQGGGRLEFRAGRGGTPWPGGRSPSGGWPYSIHFNPTRASTITGDWVPPQKGKRRDDSVLDDNNTQGVLRFLLNLSEAGGDRQDPRLDRVRTALETGLGALLGAQRPNGAWPQRFGRGSPTPDPGRPSGRAARRMAAGRDVKDYHVFHTLNDQLHRDCLLLLLEAHRALGRPELRGPARRRFPRAPNFPNPSPAGRSNTTFA